MNSDPFTGWQAAALLFRLGATASIVYFLFGFTRAAFKRKRRRPQVLPPFRGRIIDRDWKTHVQKYRS